MLWPVVLGLFIHLLLAMTYTSTLLDYQDFAERKEKKVKSRCLACMATTKLENDVLKNHEQLVACYVVITFNHWRDF